MNTMECADVTYCRASAVSRGKADHHAEGHDRQGRPLAAGGAFDLEAPQQEQSHQGGEVARSMVRNTGSNSITARRVAGKEPLKITTPIRPLIQPWVLVFGD
jgi:hypothetical protein